MDFQRALQALGYKELAGSGGGALDASLLPSGWLWLSPGLQGWGVPFPGSSY